MKIFQYLRGLIARGSTRAINGEASWFGPPTLAGVAVTEDTATTFGAFYACLNVLSSDVASIPFQVMRRDRGGGKQLDAAHPINELICHAPNADMTSLDWIGAKQWHLGTHGNAYSRIVRDSQLRPRELILLDPRKVKPERSKVSGKLFYDVEGEGVLAADIIHVANVGFNGIEGKSPVRECREAFGLGMAVERFGAAYFGNGIHAKGILTTADQLGEVEVKQLRKEIEEQHQGPNNAHRFMLLHSGLGYQSTMLPMEDAQFLATRRFQLEEMCRICRVPPNKVQNYERATHGNIEETNLDYYDSSLKPWARRFETEFNRKLFTAEERRALSVEHDTTQLLKGRVLDQAQADKIYRDMGVNNADEIRAMRNRGGPIERGGKTYFMALNMAPMDLMAEADLATIKGIKPDAPEADPADPQAPAVDGPTVDATRAVVEDVGRRMLRRESNKLRQILRKGDLRAILPELDNHFAAERSTLADALAPALAAHAAAARRSIDPRELAGRVCDGSMARIRAATEGPGTLKALAAMFDGWESGRLPEVLSHLP